ncbi:DUF5990 family protein [Variovorax sp. J22R24]|uniref:DUF5990 family protein n=1 Tax=Variovorax gracilis TaxID=3053502 RepID=UPI0025753735|nr:DUF5990 family protein [Variovorax sp. J22R24]MDM0108808.1 DUF5990 family protein [Variovorax sp. J22R24]
MKSATAPQLQVIVVVLAPPPGVRFALQKGRDELLPPYASTGDSLAFGITMDLGPVLADGSFNFRGAFAQGTPTDRFVYLNSGTLAGQSESPWVRRAKIKMAGIPRHLVEAALDDPGRAIEARILGTARDGGPVCASVQPPAITWQLTAHPPLA